MKLVTKTGTGLARMINFLAALAAVLIVSAMVFICFGVAMRYFMHNPQGWVIEIATYSIVFSTFLGAAWVLQREKHVKIDIVVNRLNPRNQAMLGIVTSIIGAIVCLFIVVYGAMVTLDFFQRGIWFPGDIEVPQAVLSAIIPLGCFFLFVQLVRRSYGYLERWRASPKK